MCLFFDYCYSLLCRCVCSLITAVVFCVVCVCSLTTAIVFCVVCVCSLTSASVCLFFDYVYV